MRSLNDYFKTKFRPWAYKRRFYYSSGFGVLALVFLILGYSLYLYAPPNCLDGKKNGGESGRDCGGRCARICTIDVIPPNVLWVAPFYATPDTFNVVAYVENKNLVLGVEKLAYTFKLYDEEGLVAERKGESPFPPNTLYPLFEGRIETNGRTPTRATIEIDPDPVWVGAQNGGEEYKTERRVLTGADERPVLTAEIKNESLEEGKDVDVVATIKDVEGHPLTASRTKVDIFPGRSTKEVIFTWQEPIAKTIRSCEVPTDVVLAIDLSGSMNNDGGTPPEPITSVLKSARAFVGRLNDEDQIGLVTFASDATLEHNLTSNHASVERAISTLVIDPESERGNTNTGEAIKRGVEELTSERHNVDARTVFILLTDGLATAPDPEPEAYALEAVTALKERGVRVFTIGLGESLNEEFLRTLATSPDSYFKAPTTATLGSIYGTITESICEEGPAVIEIIPKQSGIFESVRP